MSRSLMTHDRNLTTLLIRRLPGRLNGFVFVTVIPGLVGLVLGCNEARTRQPIISAPRLDGAEQWGNHPMFEPFDRMLFRNGLVIEFGQRESDSGDRADPISEEEAALIRNAVGSKYSSHNVRVSPSGTKLVCYDPELSGIRHFVFNGIAWKPRAVSMLPAHQSFRWGPWNAHDEFLTAEISYPGQSAPAFFIFSMRAYSPLLVHFCSATVYQVSERSLKSDEYLRLIPFPVD